MSIPIQPRVAITLTQTNYVANAKKFSTPITEMTCNSNCVWIVKTTVCDSDTPTCFIRLSHVLQDITGTLDPETGISSVDNFHFCQIDDISQGRKIYMQVRDNSGFIPNAILILNKNTTLRVNRKVSNDIIIEGNGGFLLHPISTPRTVGAGLFEDIAYWASEQDLIDATNALINDPSTPMFFNYDNSRIPRTRDVALVADATSPDGYVERYFDGSSWVAEYPEILVGTEEVLKQEIKSLEQEIEQIKNSVSSQANTVSMLQGQVNRNSLDIEANHSMLVTTVSYSIAETNQKLDDHIDTDNPRWASVLDLINANNALLLKQVQDMMSGTALPIDYNSPQTIIGTNGLLNLGGSNSWTATQNGAIICSCVGLLSVAVSIIVMRGGNTVFTWTSPVLLGLGSQNPSDPFQIETGDIITTSGLLSVGSSVSCIFYPVKV